jgi:CRP/FNR family transcriptional regulator, cyclic AMP receptor protein
VLNDFEMMSNPMNGRVSLPEIDSDLLKGVDPSAVGELRRAARARVMEIPAGLWSHELQPPRPLYGFFVLEGVLSRGVVIQGRRSAELLGPGDILRPRASDDVESSIDFEVSWDMLQPVKLGVLDEQFAQAIAPWPAFTAALMDRMIRRSHSLAFHMAVSHMKLVEARLLLILWYYADRWGRVTREGVVLPLRMTHSMLARIVGARRPSVSTALGKLTERGLLERGPGGEWILLGSPPSDLDELRDQAESAS